MKLYEELNYSDVLGPNYSSLKTINFDFYNFYLYFNGMEIFDSSQYVIERAKHLAPYFSKRGWFVTSGKSNSILINIPGDQSFDYDQIRMADIIGQSNLEYNPTGLKVTIVTYMFFHHLKLVGKFTVLPSQEFDI